MALAPGGKALTVDVTHITPAGDKEKLFFNRGHRRTRKFSGFYLGITRGKSARV
jgi:hypothetical protein